MSDEKKGFLKGIFGKKSSCCSFEIEENIIEKQVDIDKEEKKVENNDNSAGCCSNSNVCDIRCSPKNKQKDFDCSCEGGC